MRLLKLILVPVIFLAISCQKDEILPSTGYEEVTLKNLTGFDGCGFVFSKNDSKYLEPTNLKDYLTNYTVDKKYWIKYKIEHNSASICQVGDIVKIVELSDQSK